MCGIGGTIVTVDCEKVAGPTDATITTEVRNLSLTPINAFLRPLARTNGPTAPTWPQSTATWTTTGQAVPRAVAPAPVKRQKESLECIFILRLDARRLHNLLGQVQQLRLSLRVRRQFSGLTNVNMCSCVLTTPPPTFQARYASHSLTENKGIFSDLSVWF